MDIKKTLSAIRRSKKFIDYRASSFMADQLLNILGAIKRKSNTPEQGLELLEKFYQCAEPIFDRCDDSSGYIQGIFQFQASEVFLAWAKKLEDEDYLCKLVKRMIRSSDYDMCSIILKETGSFLSDKKILKLYNDFLDLSKKESPEDFSSKYSSYLFAAQDMARCLKNGDLFKEAMMPERREHENFACSIAEVYLEGNEPDKALELLLPIKDDNYNKSKCHDLLIRAYEMTGDQESLVSISVDMFNSCFSVHYLAQVEKYTGQEKKLELVEKALQQINQDTEIDMTNLHFLFEMDFSKEMEQYLISLAGKLDGNNYTYLLKYAEFLERNRKWLGLTLINRALFESIMERKYIKAYRYAARYLKKLETISSKIYDWKGITNHSEYFSFVAEIHKRKSSFWGKYEKLN